jgi:hypothetical protein
MARGVFAGRASPPEQILRVRIAGFHYRRNSRQHRRAFRGAHRQRHDLAVPDIRQRRRDRQIVEVDASGHHFGEGFDRTSERNVLDVDAGRQPQPLLCVPRTSSDMPKVKLGNIGDGGRREWAVK